MCILKIFSFTIYCDFFPSLYLLFKREEKIKNKREKKGEKINYYNLKLNSKVNFHVFELQKKRKL